MITRTRLTNFKAVGERALELELAPITILVGPNGAGKSSVLEALGVLAETASDQQRTGLVVQGSRVSFPSVDLAFHNRRMDRSLELEIDVRHGPDGHVQAHRYAMSCSKPADAGGMWVYRQTIRVHLPGNPTQFSVTNGHVARESSPGQYNAQLTVEPGNWHEQPQQPPDFLLRPESFRPSATHGNAQIQSVISGAQTAMAAVCGYLRDDVVLLSGLRGADLFVREIGPAAVRTGRFGEQSIRMMSIVQADPRRRESWRRIVNWADRFGMHGLTGGWVGSNELVASFLDPATETQLPLTSAGSGSQRLLPLLIDAFAATRPRTLLIDEIEEAAHPDWQILIAELLAEIAKAGNQVIATTHSPTLILAVCAAVAKGLLRPSDVALYGFDRDQGGTLATRLAITESGSILGGWVETFAKAERELLGAFLRGKRAEAEEETGAEQGRVGGRRRGRVSEPSGDDSGAVAGRRGAAKRRRATRA